MNKKLILVYAAIAAFAVIALPASASASPRLCETQADHATCNNIAVGSKISMHNVGHLLFLDGSGNELWTCTTGYMTGTLTANTGTHTAGNITTFDVGGTGTKAAGADEPECTGTFGNFTFDANVGNGVPWCLTAGGELPSDTFTVTGGNCGSPRSITFAWTSTTVGACKYSRANAITGTFITDKAGTEDAVLSIVNGAASVVTKEEGSIFCPSMGGLKWSFTLETDVNSSSSQTTNTVTAPLYIK